MNNKKLMNLMFVLIMAILIVLNIPTAEAIGIPEPPSKPILNIPKDPVNFCDIKVPMPVITASKQNIGFEYEPYYVLRLNPIFGKLPGCTGSENVSYVPWIAINMYTNNVDYGFIFGLYNSKKDGRCYLAWIYDSSEQHCQKCIKVCGVTEKNWKKKVDELKAQTLKTIKKKNVRDMFSKAIEIEKNLKCSVFNMFMLKSGCWPVYIA
jgi:hypothetical protein